MFSYSKNLKIQSIIINTSLVELLHENDNLN